MIPGTQSQGVVIHGAQTSKIDSPRRTNDLLLSEMRRWDTEHLRLRIEQARLGAQAAEFSVDRLLVPLAVIGVVAGATGGLVVLLFYRIGH